MNLINNRYEILPGSNRGGMGEVIRCNDTHLGREVVIKRLQAGVDCSRLLDELKSLLKVRSKHVVQLYDIVRIPSGVGGDVDAIVLEFIDGDSPAIGEYSVDDEYLRVIWQIASGLSDIHSYGIIHRDIKPNNVMIDKEGVVKIYDFGLSRSNDRAKTANVIGTPPFMAPELFRGNDIAFDSSVDVYAFGVTCLALLSGNIPSGLESFPPKMPEWSDLFLASNNDDELAEMVCECISGKAEDRPRMETVRDRLAKRLLKNRHRATVVLGGGVHVLDSKNKEVFLKADEHELRIYYDGFDFKVSGTSGCVHLNNISPKVGDVVPLCCVIAFGEDVGRRFVTFDVSNPEVMS